MKKYALLWLLVIALMVSGCAALPSDPQQTTASTTEAAARDTTQEAVPDTQAEEETTAAPETTAATETTEAEQTEPAGSYDWLDDYMESLKAQADDIHAALQEAQAQAEMNQRAYELYTLWDGALNELWGKLQEALPEDEFDKLLDEQIQWIADKEAAVEEAGKEVEGGSMYPLITNSKAASITEERVYEFYELLKQQ